MRYEAKRVDTTWHGCALSREGAKHSRYINLWDLEKFATIPRHAEIADMLARTICKQLGIPYSK
ncbi:MAG: hypothetical protein L7F77_05675 [Candidatus Magnetominusculus sp. LBB02]|nr:hypothetical protein [Candidatus Magnetominusculus sp. LBB02]